MYIDTTFVSVKTIKYEIVDIFSLKKLFLFFSDKNEIQQVYFILEDGHCDHMPKLNVHDHHHRRHQDHLDRVRDHDLFHDHLLHPHPLDLNKYQYVK